MKNGPYTLIIPPPSYPGIRYRGRYSYEHQVVWWLNTGHIVPGGYLVHHLNDDKRDNSFSNLELISRKSHACIHAKRGEVSIALICAYCGDAFNRNKRNCSAKIKAKQERFYCCRSHQVRDQHRRRNILG